MPRLQSLLLFLLLPLSLFAQAKEDAVMSPYYLSGIQHFSIEQGLFNRHVYCFKEDSKGFMWIGTKNGLHRFDGYEFKIFTREKNGLSSNNVRAITEDAEGRLWVFQNEGPGLKAIRPSSIDIIDRNPFNVHSFQEHFGTNLPFSIEDISQAFFKDQTILFSTEDGALYQYKEGRFSKIYQLAQKDHTIEELIFSPNNTLWIKSSEDVVSEISFDGEVLNAFNLPSYANTLLHADTSGRLIIQNSTRGRTFTNLLAYVESDGTRKSIPLQKLQLPIRTHDIFLGEIDYDAERDIFWCAGSGKLFTFDLESGVIDDFSEEVIDDNNALGYAAPFFFDKNNNAWIGSANGFIMITMQENKFTRYLYNQKGINDQLYSTRAIVSDDADHIIVNSYGGMRLVNIKSGVSIPFSFEYTPSDYLLVNQLSSLKNNKGHWIFGSGEGKLIRLSPEEERWFDLKSTFPNEGEAIWSLYEDAIDRIWMGTDKGIYYLDSTSTTIERMPSQEQFKQLKKSQILHFYEEADHLVWICTSTGLYEWNPMEGVEAHYSTSGQDSLYLPYDAICHMHKDDQGTYWLASRGGGLIEWNKEAGTYTQYTIADGLSHNVLYAVYEDEDEGLWLPSDYGLMRFDKEFHSVNLYLPRDGMTHEEFNTLSHFKAADGRLYFGGLNGVNAFYPSDLYSKKGPNKNKLHIIEFLQQDGNSGAFVNNTNNLVQSAAIELPPSDKSFILKVALLDYIEPTEHIYAYKIEGLDKDWTFQKRNDIRINGLPYGDYTLKIKAQGSNGQWVNEALNIPVHVIRPVFMRSWFLISAVALVGLFIFSYLKWRTYTLRRERRVLEEEVNRRTETIRKQAEELKKLDSQKSRFFTNVSHELRTPLTLILGPLGGLLKREYLKDEDLVTLLLMQKNATQLLKQVNEILDLSKLDSDKMGVLESTIELNSFVNRIIASYESYVHQQGLTVRLVYQGEKPDFIITDEEKVEQILNNLISNAIKFTPKGGLIDIRVYSWNKTIQVKVKDTGKGIHPKDLPRIFDRYFQSDSDDAPIQGGTGIGLALAKELTKLIHGNLSVESTVGQGSIFTLEFPKKTPQTIKPTILDPPEAGASPDSDQGAVPHETANNTMPGSTIMIVEDNPDMRTYIESVLNPQYQIITAENGAEALQLLKDRTNSDHSLLLPDLILSDVMMPVMDGFTLMKQIKAEAPWRSIPMVMLTAKGDHGAKLQALRVGVDDYLLKPFHEEELLARIHNLLTNYQNRKKWSEQELRSANPQIEEENNASSMMNLESTQPLISVEDQKWLKRLEEISTKHIGDYNFGIERLSDQIALSPRQLFRKVRQLTGMTPKKYIQELRFQKARQLLENKTYSSVKAVVYAIGMKDVKYFSQKFKERFGKLPSSYL